MKPKVSIICAFSIILIYCNLDVLGQRGNTRPSPNRPSSPVRYSPNRSSSIRHPNMRPNRPTHIGRPHRPPYRPYPIYHRPAFRRNYWYHPYTPYHWGSSWSPIGAFVGTLASAALITAIATNIATPAPQPIYYSSGNFYQQKNNGYIVISPPIGYAVPQIPENANITILDGITYYYYNGTFYQQQNKQYIVVSPPIGSVILHLPSGVEVIQDNEQTYYHYNGTYYQPINNNGYPAYQVIQYSD